MNRSYLYSLNALPGEDGVNIVGLSESEANIPLIYRILVSANPKATRSVIFDFDGDKNFEGVEKIAVTADYAAGVEKLASFFARLPEAYRDKCDAVIAFLRDEKNAQAYIHLECLEIYEMEINDESELEAKNAELIAELSDIDSAIEKSLEQIQNGDDFDLCELDAEYWSNTLYYSPAPSDESDSDGDGDDDDSGDSDDDDDNDDTDDGTMKATVKQMGDTLYYKPAPNGTPCGTFSLCEGEVCALPLDPKKMYETKGADGIQKIDFWRLFLMDDKDGDKVIADLDYDRAIFCLKTMFDTEERKIDGDEYLVLQHPLTEDALSRLREAAEWDAETDDENYNAVLRSDPKNPGSSKYRNMDIHMAEAHEYTREDTGAVCAGFFLIEGVATALPIDPDEFYSIGSDDSDEGEKVDNWRLFLMGADGSTIADLWYGEAMAALQSLAVYGEKFLIGEKDGYAVTTPLTAEEMKEIAAKAVGYDGESDAICPDAVQLANGDWRAYFTLRAGERAVLPLDPEIFEKKRDNGEIYAFDEYRLFVFDGESATPSEIDYKKAMKWLPKIADAKNICKCVLPDDYEYRAVKNLSTQELQALIEAVKADDSDDEIDGGETGMADEDKAEESATGKKKPSHIAYWAENKVLFFVMWASALFVHCIRSESVSGIADAARAVGWSVFCFFGSWAAGFALLAAVKIACYYFPRVPKTLCTVLAWVSFISLVWRILGDIGIGGEGFAPHLIATSSFSLGSLFSALSLYSMYYRKRPPVKKADIHDSEPELYTEEESGEATRLPQKPEKIYALKKGGKIKKWRLFLRDADGDLIADLAYKKALSVLWDLADYGENFIIKQKKDDIITAPLSLHELRLLAHKTENGALEKARRALLRFWQNKALVFSLAALLSLAALAYFGGWLSFGFLSLRFPFAGQLGFYASLFAFGYSAVRAVVALAEGGYGEKAKSALKGFFSRAGKKCASFFGSWKVRIALAVLAVSFALFVHWLGFKGGAILWAVAAFMVSLLLYFVRALIRIFVEDFGSLLGDKFARDERNSRGATVNGIPREKDEEEEPCAKVPEIAYLGESKTPCGIFSLTEGESCALPLDPKAVFLQKDGTVYFWRLFLYDESGAKIADLEYYRAIWWLKTTADEENGEVVQTLGDGREYLVLKNPTLPFLQSIADAVKADAETDDAGYARLTQTASDGTPSDEEEEETDCENDNGEDDEETEEKTEHGGKKARKPMKNALRIALLVLVVVLGAAAFMLVRNTAVIIITALLVYLLRKPKSAEQPQADTTDAAVNGIPRDEDEDEAEEESEEEEDSDISSNEDEEERKVPVILDSRESLILGDIAVTPDLSRSEAESALSLGLVSFSGKTREENREYRDSVRVMFLYANIYDQPPRDVEYSFEDYSLFQKYDGSFFLVQQQCAPFAGGEWLEGEFDRNFLLKNSKAQVLKLLAKNKEVQKSLSESRDFDALFENRSVSFYAEQRYLCFDYRVLFHYSAGNAERLKAEYEEGISHAEKCVDSERIKAHLTAEYEKALAVLKAGTWKKPGWEEFCGLKRREVAEYKRNRV